MNQVSLLTMAVRLIFVMLAGTVFFRVVEGWEWVDSYFFTVVTISTVGYGEPVPATDLGKIGATILIFAGLGVFALFIQQVAAQHLVQMDAHPGFLQRILMRMNGHRIDRQETRTADMPDDQTGGSGGGPGGGSSGGSRDKPG